MDIEGATGRRPFKERNAYGTANEIKLAISAGSSGREVGSPRLCQVPGRCCADEVTERQRYEVDYD